MEGVAMAKGENAQKHRGRDYWSRRARGKGAWDLSWGRVGKWITHRFEHAAKRRLERKILKGEIET
jgi:hypothetical protein